MKFWLLPLSGLAAAVLAVGTLVHVRSGVVAERYALGQAVEHERKVVAELSQLREEWGRLSDPLTLRTRAERELHMQVPTAEQVLR